MSSSDILSIAAAAFLVLLVIGLTMVLWLHIRKRWEKHYTITYEVSHVIKKPIEENIWWEGTTLHIRCEDDSEWALTDAQIVSHDIDFGKDSTCIIESTPLEFEKGDEL